MNRSSSVLSLVKVPLFSFKGELSVKSGFDLLERRERGPVQRRAIGRKLRAVARTIPAALETAPVQMATELRCMMLLLTELGQEVGLIGIAQR